MSALQTVVHVYSGARVQRWTSLRTARSNVRTPTAERDSPKRPHRLWRPPSLLFNGYRASFPVVKRPGRETDHSPPYNTEVQNVWSYTYIPPYVPSWRVQGQIYFRWGQGWTLWPPRCLRLDGSGLPSTNWRPVAVLGLVGPRNSE